jgi:hypothetical protein
MVNNRGLVGLGLAMLIGLLVVVGGYIVLSEESMWEHFAARFDAATDSSNCTEKVRPKDEKELIIQNSEQEGLCSGRAYQSFMFDFPNTWSVRLANSAHQENLIFNEGNVRQIDLLTFATKLPLEQLYTQELIVGGQQNRLIDEQETIQEKSFAYYGNKRVLRMVSEKNGQIYLKLFFISGYISSGEYQSFERGVVVITDHDARDIRTAVEKLIASFGTI